jgi:hypothetical protein
MHTELLEKLRTAFPELEIEDTQPASKNSWINIRCGKRMVSVEISKQQEIGISVVELGQLHMGGHDTSAKSVEDAFDVLKAKLSELVAVDKTTNPS